MASAKQNQDISSTDKKSVALELSDLLDEKKGIAHHYALDLIDQCSLCFEAQNHKKGIQLKVLYKENVDPQILFKETEATQDFYTIEDWPEVTEIIKNTHADPFVAAENAAYAIAFLLVFKITDYTILRRSARKNGFDWWLGYNYHDELLPFEEKARLEVSGLLQATSHNTMRSRAKIKLNQTKQSDKQGLIAYVIIVEFSKPQAWVMTK